MKKQLQLLPQRDQNILRRPFLRGSVGDTSVGSGKQLADRPRALLILKQRKLRLPRITDHTDFGTLKIDHRSRFRAVNTDKMVSHPET